MASNGKGNGRSGATTPASSAPEGKPSTNGSGGSNGAHAKEVPPRAAPASAASEAPHEAKAGSPGAAIEVTDAPQAAGLIAPLAPNEPPAPHVVPPAEEPLRGERWGFPFARFERRWTAIESRLLTFVLIAQILSLCAWVFLNGLSESVTTAAGCVFRAVLLAAGAGAATWFATRAKAEDTRRNFVLGSMAASIALVLSWRATAAGAGGAGGAGAFDLAVIHYFDNIKGWLQEGSTLTLLGGLRGLATRLTIWLALLGGSLATASGKHIHIDVVFRFLPKGLRLPVALLNYLFAATVCFAAVWGFFDHIAIESYGSNADDKATAKMTNAAHHVWTHAFFTRKQIGLDLRSLPHVLAGQRYDQWMTASAWNEWVDGAGFESHFDPAKVEAIKVPDGTHPPFVVSPDGETTRSALAHTLGLVFPFGLFAIALRFLLRAILTLSGYYSPDPDEAHREEIGSGRSAPEGGA